MLCIGFNAAIKIEAHNIDLFAVLKVDVYGIRDLRYAYMICCRS
jgi:hypothetical protein